MHFVNTGPHDMPAELTQPVRVVNVYIDGYNFYYAISRSSNRNVTRLKRGWCNFCLLSARLVGKAFPSAALGAVKYFTAPVGKHEMRPGEADRQELWLEALRVGTNCGVRVIKGFYAQEEGAEMAQPSHGRTTQDSRRDEVDGDARRRLKVPLHMQLTIHS